MLIAVGSGDGIIGAARCHLLGYLYSIVVNRMSTQEHEHISTLVCSIKTGANRPLDSLGSPPTLFLGSTPAIGIQTSHRLDGSLRWSLELEIFLAVSRRCHPVSQDQDGPAAPVTQG